MSISLGDYYERLSRHDWWYEMSDDHESRRKGQAQHAELHGLSRTSRDHEKMWLTFRLYHYGNGKKPVAA